MSEQKCVICGKPFEACRNKKYCSKECSDRAAEETRIKRLRERGGHSVGDIITCPTCGKSFMYSSGRKRYCSVECQRKVKKIKTDEAAVPRPRRKRAKTIAEISRAASEEGMSYGEYVNKYRI